MAYLDRERYVLMMHSGKMFACVYHEHVRWERKYAKKQDPETNTKRKKKGKEKEKEKKIGLERFWKHFKDKWGD